MLSGTASLAILAGCASSGTGTPAAGLLPQQSTRSGSSVASIGHQPARFTNVLPPSMQKLIRTGGPPVKGFLSQAARVPGGAHSFYSDYNNGVVYILNATGQLTGTLSGFSEPEGLATDRAGNLYVANSGAGNIMKCPPPGFTCVAFLNDQGARPTDVAEDNAGNFAVANATTGEAGAGNVTFYAKGSANPTFSVANPEFAGVASCAFDADGNLYLDGFSSASLSPLVGEVTDGFDGNGISILTTNNAIGYPGSVQVTTGGLIAIGDQLHPAIYSYNPPLGAALGSPVATTPLIGASVPASFAFTPGSTHAVTADAMLNVASLYDFPAGGSPVISVQLPAGLILGNAVNPTEQY